MKQGTVSLPARDDSDAHGHDSPNRAASSARDPSASPGSAGNADDCAALDRHAAAGGMAPERIARILADLAPVLAGLHRAGRAHGNLSPFTIGLDASGRAHLLSPAMTPAANAEGAPRRDGYAAFEQYTDDPDTPCGPWTDIYALSATACALLTGLPPPPALARCVRDDYVPLTQRRGADEYAFCEVLDRGLAVDAYARPQTIDEFARALRLDAISRGPAQPADPRPVPDKGTVDKDAGQRSHTLEDSDGLETTAAWASARTGMPAAGASPAAATNASPGASAAQATDAPPRETFDTAKETDDADTPVAVSRTNRRNSGKTFRAAASMPPAKKPRRVPLLMTMAIVALLGAALYAWLRPQAPRQARVVASTPGMASGSASDATGSAGPGPRDATTPDTAPQHTATPSPATSGSPRTGGGNPSAAPASQPDAHMASLSTSGTSSSGASPDNSDTSASQRPNGGAGTTAGASGTGTSADASTGTGSGSGSRNTNGIGPNSSASETPSSDTKTTTPQDSAKKPRIAAANKSPVTVSVAIRPWGEILVNGRSRGVSPPLRSLTLPPGKYEITIRNNAGPDYRQTLNVTAGGSAVIFHTFQ